MSHRNERVKAGFNLPFRSFGLGCFQIYLLCEPLGSDFNTLIYLLVSVDIVPASSARTDDHDITIFTFLSVPPVSISIKRTCLSLDTAMYQRI